MRSQGPTFSRISCFTICFTRPPSRLTWGQLHPGLGVNQKAFAVRCSEQKVLDLWYNFLYSAFHEQVSITNDNIEKLFTSHNILEAFKSYIAFFIWRVLIIKIDAIFGSCAPRIVIVSNQPFVSPLRGLSNWHKIMPISAVGAPCARAFTARAQLLAYASFNSRGVAAECYSEAISRVLCRGFLSSP